LDSNLSWEAEGIEKKCDAVTVRTTLTQGRSRSSGVDEGKCRRYLILDVREGKRKKLYIVYSRMLYILIIYGS